MPDSAVEQIMPKSYAHSAGLKIHRLIWASAFGEIPPGYVVHHIDGNKRNNVLDNLQCMSIEAHSALHRPRVGLRHCSWCGHECTWLMHGLCSVCYDYKRRNSTLIRRLHTKRYKQSRWAGVHCSCGMPVYAKGKCRQCYHTEWSRNSRNKKGQNPG